MSAQPLREESSSRQAFHRLGGDVDVALGDADVVLGDVLARRRIGTLPAIREPVAIVDDRQLHAPPVVKSEVTEAAAIVEGLGVKQESAPRRFRWVRNMLLGASVSFADASVIALNPVGFVWKNVHTIALAAIYLLSPLTVSLFLLDTFPALANFCRTETFVGMLYLLGLYLSSAAMLMLGAFTAGFLGRSTLRLMDHFAKRGEEAFPKA